MVKNVLLFGGQWIATLLSQTLGYTTIFCALQHSWFNVMGYWVINYCLNLIQATIKAKLGRKVISQK